MGDGDIFAFLPDYLPVKNHRFYCTYSLTVELSYSKKNGWGGSFFFFHRAPRYLVRVELHISSYFPKEKKKTFQKPKEATANNTGARHHHHPRGGHRSLSLSLFHMLPHVSPESIIHALRLGLGLLVFWQVTKRERKLFEADLTPDNQKKRVVFPEKKKVKTTTTATPPTAAPRTRGDTPHHRPSHLRLPP